MAYGFYLYGIFPLPGPQNLSLEGLDKQPVRTHQVDGFIFLYSEAQQERYLASRRNLIGHARVLEKAMEAGYRTLLPLPLNRIIVQNWAEVVEQFTTPHGLALQKLFQKLEGAREVSVKVYWEQQWELEQLMIENQALKAQRDQLEGKALSMEAVIGIGQAIEAGLMERQDQIIAQFEACLNGFAIEIVENEVQTDAMIYNTAYLIPWEAEAEFGTQVEALDRQFSDRLRIRYNNFTAPYNFAQLEQFSA